MDREQQLQIAYDEYLRVKDAIEDTAMELNYCAGHSEHHHMVAGYQKDLAALLERFPLVLTQLADFGLESSTLLLKSIGVNFELVTKPTLPVDGDKLATAIRKVLQDETADDATKVERIDAYVGVYIDNRTESMRDMA